jgi:hypothetical protein
MLGITFYLSAILMAVSSLVPLVTGIYFVRNSYDYASVALLALFVSIAQGVLGLLVIVLITGSASFQMLFTSLNFVGSAFPFPAIFSLLVGYLKVFAVLAACYMFFVESNGKAS